MKKNLALTIKHLTLVALMVLAFSACRSIVGPSDNSNPVVISPTSAGLGTGDSKHFSCTGGDGNFVWTTTGGGTIQPSADGRTADFTAKIAGDWQATCSSGGKSASAAVQVIAERVNSLELVSYSPASGSTIASGSPASFTVKYQTAIDNLQLRVIFLDQNGKPVNSFGSPVLLEAVGVTSVAGLAVGGQQTSAVRFDFYKEGINGTQASFLFTNINYSWK